MLARTMALLPLAMAAAADNHATVRKAVHVALRRGATGPWRTIQVGGEAAEVRDVRATMDATGRAG